jgi:hypothetical protein
MMDAIATRAIFVLLEDHKISRRTGSIGSIEVTPRDKKITNNCCVFPFTGCYARRNEVSSYNHCTRSR